MGMSLGSEYWINSKSKSLADFPFHSYKPAGVHTGPVEGKQDGFEGTLVSYRPILIIRIE